MRHPRTPCPPAVATGVLVTLMIVLAGCGQEPVTAPSVPGSTSAPASVSGSAEPSGAPSAARPSVPASSTPSTKPSSVPSSTPSTAPSTSPSKLPKSEQTVEPKAVRSKKAVAPGTVSTVRRGLVVEVRSIRATQVKASGPGEADGPGAVVRLTVRNDTGKRLDLDTVGVSLTATAAVLADSTTGPPADPLAGRLADGDSSAATYVFATDAARGSRVSVNVAFGVDDPVSVTTGTLR